jgi:hypothetical protein
MDDKAKKSPDSGLLEAKMLARRKFVDELKLDDGSHGGKVAALIEDLEERYPDEWESKLDAIITEAKRLEAEGSAKDSMLYLSDIMHEIDIRKTKEKLKGDESGRDTKVALKMTLYEMYKGHITVNGRDFAGVDNAFVPDWWMMEEVDRGGYDEILRRIGGSRETFMNILGKGANNNINA